MSSSPISFEQKVTTVDFSDARYFNHSINVMCNNRYLLPDEDIEKCQQAVPTVSLKYWDLIRSFLANSRAVAILSGLHFNVRDFLTSPLYRNFPQTNYIYHCHCWKSLDAGTSEDAYVILECPNATWLQEIYTKFWFSIGAEVHMRILIMDTAFLPRIEPWSRLDNEKSMEPRLLEFCKLLFDNMHNGFHIRIASGTKIDSNVLQRALA